MGFKDLFRARRKSANLIPTTEQPVAVGADHPVSSGTAGYGPMSVLTAGAQREQRGRSKSVFNQPSAGLLYRPVVDRPSTSSTGVPAKARNAPHLQWNKPKDSALAISASPMSRLLITGGREFENSVPGSPTGSIGPTEFLELYRGRTYSDPRAAEVILEARRRKSDARAPDTSVSPLNDAVEVLHKSAAEVLTRNDSKSLLLSVKPHPPSIPEHQVVNHDSHSKLPVTLTPPGAMNPRYRKLSVFTPLVSATNDLKGGATGLENDSARSRRFSEPFVTGGLREFAVANTMMNAMRHDSISHAMANFPKFTAVTPTPPICPRSLGIDLPCEEGPLIIWKDRTRGTQMFRLPLQHDELDEFSTDFARNQNTLFVKYMKRHSCYELMPNSAKLVLLDTELMVISAFDALIFNGIRAAPVWNSAKKEVVAMLTVTDFIEILVKFHSSKNDLTELEGHKISDWLSILGYRQKLLGCIEPDENLFEALRRLEEKKVHRLLVADGTSSGVLYVLTYKRILKFLYLLTYNSPHPPFMQESVYDLGVGTYQALSMINMNSTVFEALQKFKDGRVSALPVVDAEHRVLNIYCKADIINMVSNGSYRRLNSTVQEALSYQRDSFEGLYLCKKTDKLGDVVEWVVKKNIHRLIVVNEEQKLEGIISLSDIVSHLVLKQVSESSSASSPRYDSAGSPQKNSAGSPTHLSAGFSNFPLSETRIERNVTNF